MSAQGLGSDLSVVVSEMKSLQFEVRAGYAALATLTYELIVTLPAEIEHIWQAKRTLVFYLFVGLRYPALLSSIFEAFSDFLPIIYIQGCIGIAFASGACKVVAELCLCGIFTLRAYAIWNRNTYVLLCLTTLTLGRLLTTAWGTFSGSAYIVPGIPRQITACNTINGPLTVRLNATYSALVLAFDTAVLLLTLLKTAQEVHACRRLKIGQGLTYFLFRDGIMYFLSIEIWMVAALATTYLPVPSWTEHTVSMMEAPVATILTQRLALNLRQFDQELHSPSFIPSLNLGELSFAHGPVLGNIGAPLRDPADECLGLDVHEEEMQVDRDEADGSPMGPEQATGQDILAIEEVPRPL